MPSLLATVDTDNAAVSIVINWSDTSVVTGSGVSATVLRHYPDGTTVEVLGSPTYLSEGRAVFWDTVTPLDVGVFYTALSSSSSPVVTGGLTSATVTVTGTGDGWLKDPVQPVNDVHLVDCVTPCPDDPVQLGDDPLRPGPVVVREASLQTLDSSVMDSANGVFPIIDAARHRTVSQTRKARASRLRLLTHTLPQAQGVVNLLASGRVLFLQLAHSYGWAYDNWASDYVDVGTVEETRISATNMSLRQRLWALPFRLGRASVVTSGHVGGNGVGVAGTTYGDGYASGRTYQDRVNLPNTYQDTALGTGL